MLKIFMVILCFVSSTMAQQPAAPSNPCAHPEATAFDWQIGVWQSEDGKQVHEIRKILDGCAIQESWNTDGKETAVGLKSFDNGLHHKKGDKRWVYSWLAQGFHQLWEGRKEDGEWRFYREWFSGNDKILSRTYWRPIGSDRLERIVEQSRDEGKSWRLHLKVVFVRKSSQTPGVRNAHALVYDAARQRTVLFGGADSEKVLNDTWEFDGEKWSLLAVANGPSGRTFPAVTYDSSRHKILLFGGNRVLFGKDRNDHEFLNDFWEFDGTQWTPIKVATPEARAEAAFTFDAARQKAVLFGGYRIENGTMKRLSDTWEWDGRVWRQVAEGRPSARSGAAMTYDTRRHKVVLFGGGIRNGGGNETWEWNGKTWHQIKSAQSEPRYNSTMVFDESRNRIIRFGGWDGTQRVSETWEFDGKVWRRLAIESPEPRNHAALAYDRRRHKIILFGGHNGDFVFGDTWEFDGSVWQKGLACAPQRRVENGH